MRKAPVMVALFAISFPICASAQDHHATVQADAAKSRPGPAAYPSGAQFAIASEDPSKAGFYVVRLKVPAGCKTPHAHPNDENVPVISGSFNIGTGDKLDPKGHYAQDGWLLACSESYVKLRVVDGRHSLTGPWAGTAGHYLRQSCR